MGDTSSKIVSFLKGLVPYIVILILVIILKTYVVTPVRVRGNSMYPSLEENDIMILDIITYRLKGVKRFDIVVINQGDELIIKRVIGLPGEKIEYKDSELYVNGKFVEDPFATNYSFTDDVSITIPEGEYYVLGDNRHVSLDSRTFGTFNKKQIIGKTDLIVYPFHRFGITKIDSEK